MAIEQALRDADHFHSEYRQNLRTSLKLADSWVRRAEPSEQALALVYRARVLRLRGEYLAAGQALSQAEGLAGTPPLDQLRIQSERRFTELDRVTSTAGALKFSALLEQPLLNETRERLQPSRPANRLAPFRSDSTARRAARAIVSWDMAAFGLALSAATISSSRAQGSDPLGGHKSASLAFEKAAGSLEDAIENETDIHPLAAQHSERLRLRLMGSLLSRTFWLDGQKDMAAEAAWAAHVNELSALRGIAPIAQAAACPGREPDGPAPGVGEVDVWRMLLCAEAFLFPGSVPEELGFIVDVQRASQSDLWAAKERAASQQPRLSPQDLFRAREPEFLAMRSRLRKSGLRYLAAVRRALAFLPYERARVYVELLAVSDELLEWMTPADVPVQGGRSLPVLSSLRARLAAEQQRALALGDHRLALQAQILSALAGSFAAAGTVGQIDLEQLFKAAAVNHDFGAVLGAARLYASVAVVRAFKDFTPSEVQHTFELAGRLFAQTGASLEGSYFAQRHAEVLMMSSELEAAAAVLEQWDERLLRAALSKDYALEQTIVRLQGLFSLGSLYVSLRDYERLGTAHDRVVAITEKLCQGHRVEQAAEYSLAILKPMLCGLSETHALAWQLFLTFHQDQQDIHNNPDLDPRDSQQFARTVGILQGISKSTSTSRELSEFAAMFSAQIAWLRSLSEATEPTPDLSGQEQAQAQTRQSLQHCHNVQATAPERAFCQSIIYSLLGQARHRLRIQQVGQAQGILTALRLELGEKWLSDMSEPWRYRMIALQVETALHAPGEPVKAIIAGCREMVDELEARRLVFSEERERLLWLDTEDAVSVYEAAVDIAARLGDAAAAFEFMERGKARSLQDIMNGSRSPPIERMRRLALTIRRLDQVRSDLGCQVLNPPSACAEYAALHQGLMQQYRDALPAAQAATAPAVLNSQSPADLAAKVAAILPPRAVLLSSYFTSSGLATVLLRHGKAPRVVHTRLLRSDLEGRTERLSSNLQFSYLTEKSVAPDGQRLSRAMLQEPLAAEDLSAVDEVILIPHSVLHRLPAAFLPFVEGERSYAHLIQRFKLRTLPFAGLMLNNRERPPSCSRPLSALRILTNDNVPEAKQEAVGVAEQYGSPRFATRQRASRADFFAALEGSHIVHAALHGRASDRAERPSSASPVKPDEGYAFLTLRDGPVTVFDLLAHPRPLCADLVVLASCHLGRGRRSAGDEETGIARALLGRQIGDVIGSLWKLTSQGPDKPGMATLMADFHHSFRRTGDAAQSLAEAQRQAIQRHLPAQLWTGLIVIGR